MDKIFTQPNIRLGSIVLTLIFLAVIVYFIVKYVWEAGTIKAESQLRVLPDLNAKKEEKVEVIESTKEVYVLMPGEDKPVKVDKTQDEEFQLGLSVSSRKVLHNGETLPDYKNPPVSEEVAEDEVVDEVIEEVIEEVVEEVTENEVVDNDIEIIDEVVEEVVEVIEDEQNEKASEVDSSEQVDIIEDEGRAEDEQVESTNEESTKEESTSDETNKEITLEYINELYDDEESVDLPEVEDEVNEDNQELDYSEVDEGSFDNEEIAIDDYLDTILKDGK